MNVYYTPTLEDLKVGYEFEYNGHYTHMKSEWEKKVITPEWYGMNHDSGWDPDPTITFYMGMLRAEPKNFRVPYLTKEQIEAEGWKVTDHITGVWAEYKHYTLRYELESHRLEFVNTNQDHCIYDGGCPSINEFRTICKLIGIDPK